MIEQKLSPIQQCEANVRRICGYHGIPVGALWEDPRTDPRVRKVNAGDRVFTLGGSAGQPRTLAIHFLNLVGEGRFTESPLSMVQAKHGPTATHGWRENRGSLSLQVVRHEIAMPNGTVAIVYEFDIDHGNPRKWWMAWPALVHLAEVIRPGPTDPYRIDRDLRKHRKELFA